MQPVVFSTTPTCVRRTDGQAYTKSYNSIVVRYVDVR